jgi:hypothetical protein
LLYVRVGPQDQPGRDLQYRLRHFPVLFARHHRRGRDMHGRALRAGPELQSKERGVRDCTASLLNRLPPGDSGRLLQRRMPAGGAVL